MYNRCVIPELGSQSEEWDSKTGEEKAEIKKNQKRFIKEKRREEKQKMMKMTHDVHKKKKKEKPRDKTERLVKFRRIRGEGERKKYEKIREESHKVLIKPEEFSRHMRESLLLYEKMLKDHPEEGYENVIAKGIKRKRKKRRKKLREEDTVKKKEKIRERKVKERRKPIPPDGRSLVPGFRGKSNAIVSLRYLNIKSSGNLRLRTGQVERYKGRMRGKVEVGCKLIGQLEVLRRSSRTRGAIARIPGLIPKREN